MTKTKTAPHHAGLFIEGGDFMDDAWVNLISAAVSGLLVAIPTIIATVTSNKAHDKIVDERMKYMLEKITDLTAKVEKHNEFNDRLIIVEQSVKSAHHRLDLLQGNKEE